MRLIVYTFILLFLASHGVASPDLRYAENFEVEKRDGFRLLTIRNTWIGSGSREQKYALVPREAALPKVPKDAIVIRTPIERLVILETVFLSSIRELELYDALVGMAYVDYTHDEIALERVADGKTKEVPAGMATDVETLLLMQPDLILTSTIGSPTFDGHERLLRAGLPVVVAADYMEKHPLARAEWIKFLALFFGKDAEAEVSFDRVAKRYESLVALTAEVGERPTVMYGAPYGGLWHVPGGRSYMAQALKDAGADYLWSDNESSGGVPIDIEVILEVSAGADYWLHPSFYDSERALLAADERFAGLRPFREGRVFNNTLRVNERGGNDIFERGVARPDEVLADLIKVLHPQLVPEHEFVYYERLQ